MKFPRASRLAVALAAVLAVQAFAGDPPAAPASKANTPATAVLQPAASQAGTTQQPAASQSDSTQQPAATGPSTAAPSSTPQDKDATALPAPPAKPATTTKSGPTPHAAPIPLAAAPAQPVPQPAKTAANAPPPAAAAQPANVKPKELAKAVAQSADPNGASGFRLMTLSTNALLTRVSLADQAKRSIDLQYYLFNNDATGRLIALHLLQAADRGVKVRILVDDLHMKDEMGLFDALDASPNIEVKLFNPFSSPDPSAVSKMAQFLLEFRRLNRRMHNKSYIVDNEVAVIGGRNIGDAFFDATLDNNFRDLDVLAIGPVVPAATASFESYWNSDAARPASAFRSKEVPASNLAAWRAELEKNARKFDQSAYLQAAAEDLPNGASADRPGNWFWGPSTLVADQPEKIDNGPERTDLRIGPRLKALINSAHSEVLLVTPYFVPGKKDDENFVALAQRGVAFKVLTNSLASTDEVAVHEGYVEHRRILLKGGLTVYELKPEPGVVMASSDAGLSSGISLHAKAFVVDRRYVFIGSLNMDQRSKLLNTEMGVIVDSPELAKSVANFFTTATLPANAFHVVLGSPDGKNPDAMHWQASKDGKDVEYDNEPETSVARRAKVQLLKLLPIDGLL